MFFLFYITALKIKFHISIYQSRFNLFYKIRNRRFVFHCLNKATMLNKKYTKQIINKTILHVSSQITSALIGNKVGILAVLFN